MMVTVSELEAIIAETPPGEQVQYETRLIGSVDDVTRKLTELKLSRSGDPDYLIFVGVDRFGECFLAAFSTIGDPLEFRARRQKQLAYCRTTMRAIIARAEGEFGNKAMPTGTLKMWNADRGYGFIADDAGGPDMFLHISALQAAGIDPGNIKKGERLTFDVESTREGKTRATNVRRPG